MTRKWLVCCLVVGLSLALLASVTLASGAPLRIQRYWGGSFSWSLDLTGSETKSIYDTMDDAAGGAAGGVVMLKILEKTLGRLLPYLAAVGAATKIGSLALQRCSDKGRRDVTVHGWGTKAVDWPATEERDRIAWESGDYDWRGYIYQDIFVPLWCNGN